LYTIHVNDKFKNLFANASVSDKKGRRSRSISWLKFITVATFITQNHVQLILEDGGVGDADGAANGINIDPSGVGLGASRALVTPAAGSGGSGGCFIATVAYGSFLVTIVWGGFIGFIGFIGLIGLNNRLRLRLRLRAKGIGRMARGERIEG